MHTQEALSKYNDNSSEMIINSLFLGLLDHQGSFGSKGVNLAVNEAEALL